MADKDNGLHKILINLVLVLIMGLFSTLTIQAANTANNKSQKNEIAIGVIQECMRNQKETSKRIEGKIDGIGEILIGIKKMGG